MGLPFLKMHGLGNDFVVIDDLGKPQALLSPITTDLAQKICDRRFGVGADQILWLKSAKAADSDAKMDIFNPDGSVAEMCGNGIRAVALYLYKHGPKPRQSEYRVETLAGLMHLKIQDELVTVNMGAPKLGRGFDKSEGSPIRVQGKDLWYYEVSMGNPHAVFFVDDVESFPVAELGALIEKDPLFPKRTNVEFVQIKGPSTIQVRVWERGTGITLACGTGACASAVASLALRKVKGEVTVKLPGGDLKIDWAGLDQPVMMQGPAEEVFRGEFYL